MKRVKLSLIAILAGSSFAVGGGDLIIVTPYEIEDEKAAEVIEVIEVTPPLPTPVPTPIPIPKVETKSKVIVAPPVVAPLPDANVSALYVGVGMTVAKYKTNCKLSKTKSGSDITFGGVVRIGYDFNEYLGMEARALMTPMKADGGEIQHYGAFVKPMYPVTNSVNVYAFGGIAKTTTKGSLRKTDVSGLAFGAGLEYDISEDKKKDAKYEREFDGKADQEKGFGVFADYERLYYKKGSPDLDALSVGLTYDF